jgi:hypothetical protein
MEKLTFRTLKADEIDARVSQVTDNGVSLLLYKDARCDMNLLDETVGPMNWIRSHSRDNANCTVGIWDEDKEQWIMKEDTGTESNTEAQKGLASDSFKRACFNWGIGRELYTAPFIWISAKACNIKEGRNGKPACYDKFKVTGIDYKDREICRLEITNMTTGNVCYTYGERKPEWICNDCGKPITAARIGETEYPAEFIMKTSQRRHGLNLCATCLTQRKANADESH